MKKMTEENNEEWIEKIEICPDCVKGRKEHWKAITSKSYWKYYVPCTTCNGQYETKITHPKFCQVNDCSSFAEYKCTGVFCIGESWVCENHWMEEDIGFSESGYACITCWHEVGSGGH
tara:strand:+ start:49 stop:402 length:354 start_codon:yes stop_codon:yes gene_type:complete